MFRRTLCLALSVLATLAIGGVANAQGIKNGQSTISNGNPGSFSNPVHPGGIADYTYTLTRNGHNGAAGTFTSSLTYTPLSPPTTRTPHTAAAPPPIHLN